MSDLIEAIGEHGAPSERLLKELIELLRDEDEFIRYDAIMTLFKLDLVSRTEVKVQLKAMVKDPSMKVSRAAFGVLSSRRAQKNLQPYLVSHLGD